MRKLLLLLITTFVVLFAGCKSKPKADSSTQANATGTLSAPSYLLTDTVLPQSLDLAQDISQLSFQELRLLRSYAYALHGYHFMEADINAFFAANTQWYSDLAWKLWETCESSENTKFPEQYEDVKLTADEQAFVARIDARIAELQKQKYIDKGSYSLGNAANIVNLFQFKDIDTTLISKLQQNNFVISNGANLQLFHAYEENDYRQVPNFITTDLYLQAFHTYFSYVLRSLEKQSFIPTLQELCLNLYKGSMRIAQTEADKELKNIAEYNATFYAIPYYLLTQTKLAIPAAYDKDFEKEIQQINNQKDDFSEFLSYTDVYFPYSLFKPRGHYTREPKMQAYFQTMMWMQAACFCRENKQQLQHAIFQATLLNTVKDNNGDLTRELYKRIYQPITYLTGLPDNLSVMDITRYLAKEKIEDMQTALSAHTLTKVNAMLIELAKSRNSIKPKIEISCRDKINFMPQRYLADNEILQELVDVRPNSKRAYPKGLDVFAAFGSSSAERLLNDFYKENESWSNYATEMQKLKDKFKKKEPVELSVYNLWIDNLLTLQKTDKNDPGFMQTTEWGYKNLNTSLASWAELKHDAILYGEQPLAAECGGAGPPDPIVMGYVEPNLPFWKKLAQTVQETKALLQKSGLYSEDLKGKTEQLADYINFLIQVTQKELRGEKLTVEEYRTIEYMGSSIEYFTLSILDPDLHMDSWSLVQGPDKSIAVVADIYTRNVPECNKNGVLYQSSPTLSQRKTAHRLIDAGTDAIIGHHPHVIQKEEYYQEKPIFYSLGNFIFDQHKPETSKAVIVQLHFRRHQLSVTTHPVAIKACKPQI